MTFAEAAVQVLTQAGAPLHFRDITKRVVDQGLVEIQGLTPWNSMNGALRRVIRSQGKESPVVSLGDGRFALRIWNLPGEEILLPDEEDEVVGSITISPRAQQGPEAPWRALIAKGIDSARQVAGLMVPLAPEYKTLHTTLSTILGSGLFSILWGLGLSASRKPGSVGLANSMLTLGCAESAAAAVGLQQLTEAETDVVSGKISMRQVRTQMSAYHKVLSYGSAVGTTAFLLGMALRLGAPANTRTRGLGTGLMTHGVLLALMAWRTNKHSPKAPSST